MSAGDDRRRLTRVLRLLYLIEERPYRYPRAALASRFEVSPRTIDNDLELLRGVGFEIKRHPQGYSIDAWPEFAVPGATNRRPETSTKESHMATLRTIITEDLDQLWVDNAGEVWDGWNIRDEWSAEELDREAVAIQNADDSYSIRYLNQRGYTEGAEALLRSVAKGTYQDEEAVHG